MYPRLREEANFPIWKGCSFHHRGIAATDTIGPSTALPLPSSRRSPCRCACVYIFHEPSVPMQIRPNWLSGEPPPPPVWPFAAAGCVRRRFCRRHQGPPAGLTDAMRYARCMLNAVIASRRCRLLRHSSSPPLLVTFWKCSRPAWTTAEEGEGGGGMKKRVGR